MSVGAAFIMHIDWSLPLIIGLGAAIVFGLSKISARLEEVNTTLGHGARTIIEQLEELDTRLIDMESEVSDLRRKLAPTQEEVESDRIL